MSIATDRFIGVLKPVFYRSQKLSYSRKTHFLIYLLPSVVSSILINIPKFLETELIIVNRTSEENITREVLDYEITSLRLDQDYVFYYINWTRLIFTGVIPFIYLIVVNMLIVLAIKKKIPSIRINSTSLRRQRLCNVISKQDPKLPKTKLPRHSAFTLVAISIMFLICNLPRIFLNIAEWNIELVTMIDDNGCEQAPDWFEVLMSLSNFSLTINSAVNCIIYYYFTKKFKKKINNNIRWVQALVWSLIITTGGSWWSSHTF